MIGGVALFTAEDVEIKTDYYWDYYVDTLGTDVYLFNFQGRSMNVPIRSTQHSDWTKTLC